jgi:hypothetical protein
MSASEQIPFPLPMTCPQTEGTPRIRIKQHQNAATSALNQPLLAFPESSDPVSPTS